MKEIDGRRGVLPHQGFLADGAVQPRLYAIQNSAEGESNKKEKERDRERGIDVVT